MSSGTLCAIAVKDDHPMGFGTCQVLLRLRHQVLVNIEADDLSTLANQGCQQGDIVARSAANLQHSLPRRERERL
jgi:hypothetical protein